MTAPAPVAAAERLEAIDVLRGVALFGVLMVNLITEFRVSIFQQFLPTAIDTTAADRVVEWFVSVVLESKAFCLFSLLFGVGLAIQFDRLSRRGPPLRWLVRRLLVLLVLGAIHLCLIWNGDILTQYALAGFIALPFLFGPTRILLAGSMLFLLLYLALPLLPSPIPWPDPAWTAQHIAEANRMYATGRLPEILRFSFREAYHLLPLHIHVLPRTIALFLFGAFVWRTGILRNTKSRRGVLITVALFGILAGATLTALDATNYFPQGLASIWQHLLALAPIGLAIGYAAAVICLVELTGGARSPLSVLGPLGRTAFSNYVMQSILFGWIFFGYGLGLFGQLGAAAAFVLGLAVYCLQVMTSSWWIRRYRFGPVEWLWRTLMYSARQPMLLARAAADTRQS
jgi:uncharacterized protein